MFCYFVFFFERYLFLVCGGGLVFLCFAPFSVAVFSSASVFNADISKWITGAVTTMQQSKCTLSSSLWTRRLPLLCVVECIRQLEVRRVTSLTRVVLVFGCGLKRDLVIVVCGGLVFLFFVAPSLAVFSGASAFNGDISAWNVGAVTAMSQSTYTLSPPLSPRSGVFV